MRLECLTCHGTYDDELPDGMEYFHACPPLSLPELQKAVDEQRVTLPAGETVEQAHDRRTYERARKRDERPHPVPDPDPTRTRKILSEGRGVRTIEPVNVVPRIIVVPD